MLRQFLSILPFIQYLNMVEKLKNILSLSHPVHTSAWNLAFSFLKMLFAEITCSCVIEEKISRILLLNEEGMWKREIILGKETVMSNFPSLQIDTEWE